MDKRSLDKILLVRTGWDRLGGQHVVERYLDTLKPFGNALERLREKGMRADSLCRRSRRHRQSQWM